MAMAAEEERIQFRCSKSLKRAAAEAGRRSGGISADQWVKKLIERILDVPNQDFWMPDTIKLEQATGGHIDPDPLQHETPKRGRTPH